MSTPTFVVGTGRCGSTMLSNMLREHPKVLFFLFLTDGARSPDAVAAAFPSELIDGSGIWKILANLPPYFTFTLRHGIPNPEVLYLGCPDDRYSFQTGVPAILLTTLPHLTRGYDALFDLLSRELAHWPAAPVGDQYRRLFGWLATHFGKRLWVERSGGGLGMTHQFLTTFPDARIMHLIRDGRDAALSMHAHKGFRHGVVTLALGQHLEVDPIVSADRTFLDRVPVELYPFLPENFAIDVLDQIDVPLPLCGEFWTQQVKSGLEELSALPDHRLLTLRYEDFFIDPKTQLDTLTAFLGPDYIDEDWSARCAATVRKPRSTWRDLPEDEARALTEACRPGFELLAAAGVDYEV